MRELRWVFDTVVLCNFLLSESNFILEKRFYKRGIIMWEVYDEISAGISDYPRLKSIEKLIENNTINLFSLSKNEHKRFLGLIGNLGKGEASCIAAAKEQGGIVMTDDRTARMQCRQIKIPFSGTIGILKSSFLDRQITLDQADKILHRMVSEGFYSPVRNISDII